jgi:hypothetical protein
MAKRAKKTAAPSAAFEATRLLGRWTKLAQGHVVFGSGCSCGVGFANLRLQDFEPQILDYLRAKHGFTGHTAIADLLRAVALQGPGKDAGAQLALLADLARSLESFDELHRGRPS